MVKKIILTSIFLTAFLGFFALSINSVSANTAPSISSASDAPDPIAPGKPITFSVDWSDPTDNTKIKICKTNSLTGVNCSGGYWCQTTVWSGTSPTSCNYNVPASAAQATNNYYAFVCDDANVCSASFAGTFTIQDMPPDVITTNATAVKSTTATLNGTITGLNGANVTKYGFEWGTIPGDYASWNSWESGAVNYSAVPQGITHPLTGLTPGTAYYFRAKAYNSAGWGYAPVQASFTTFGFFLLASPNSGSVTPGSNVQTTIVTAFSAGAPSYIVSFSASPAISGVTYTFSPTSCSATCGSLLDIRTSAFTPVGSYVITITGTSPPSQGNLTTTTSYALTVGYAAPAVSTIAATTITKNSARLNGNITATGGQNADQRGFEWGTSPGSYTDEYLASGSFGTGAFNRNITGLLSGTTYYFRAKAHNSVGWGYGEEMSFTTKARVTVTVAGTAFGTVTSAPAGITCSGINGVTRCSFDFDGASSVTLTAIPVLNFIFAGWSGDCSGIGSCVLTMNGDKAVTATFNTKGNALILRPNANGDLNQFVSQEPASGSHWEKVAEAVKDDSTSYIYTQSVDCPTCDEKAELFRYPAPSGSGTINSVSVVYGIYGSGSVNFYTEIKTEGERNTIGLGAPPSSSWLTYSSTYTTNPITGGAWNWTQLNSIQAGAGGYISDAGIVAITQVYLLIDYGVSSNAILTVNKTGTGAGTVTSTPIGINCGAACSATYSSGTDVALNVSAGAGSTFAGWSGGCLGTEPCVVNMNGNKTVTAEFNLILNCMPHNVYGYSWSENVGWISTNCANTVAVGSGNDFGLDISSSTGLFSGHAWSENVGWIDFAPAGPYPALPDYPAKVDLITGQMSGWARVLANSGGWDGWIKLRGTNYGVSAAGSPGTFSGYAWSDAVVGWISFSGSNYGVTTTLPFGPPSNSPPSKPATSEVSWNRCSFRGGATPTFSWTYFDPDGDPQAAYEIELDDNASFNAPKFNHLVNSPSTSYVLDLSQDDDLPDPGGDWISELAWNTTYFWHVRVKDNKGNWSEWSNSSQLKTDKHASPWVVFNYTPAEPTTGETVEFDSSDIESFGGALSYLWTILSGTGVFVDGTTNATSSPHIQFSTLNNTVRLEVTDSDDYICYADKDVIVQYPLPEYKEVPPVIWIRKFLASLIDKIY